MWTLQHTLDCNQFKILHHCTFSNSVVLTLMLHALLQLKQFVCSQQIRPPYPNCLFFSTAFLPQHFHTPCHSPFDLIISHSWTVTKCCLPSPSKAPVKNVMSPFLQPVLLVPHNAAFVVMELPGGLTGHTKSINRSLHYSLRQFRTPIHTTNLSRRNSTSTSFPKQSSISLHFRSHCLQHSFSLNLSLMKGGKEKLKNKWTTLHHSSSTTKSAFRMQSIILSKAGKIIHNLNTGWRQSKKNSPCSKQSFSANYKIPPWHSSSKTRQNCYLPQQTPHRSRTEGWYKPLIIVERQTRELQIFFKWQHQRLHRTWGTSASPEN